MINCPKFSIVMPVYNVEKYLNDAVNSVITQTFSDFELILVDDCSPDSSPAICDELSASDSRIKTVHLSKNGGLSNARNTGIDNTCGKYIMFMDSDDIIENYLLEKVNDSLNRNDADVVVFGMKEYYYDKSNTLSKIFSVSYGNEILTSDLLTVRKNVIHLEQKTLLGYSCNKFYKRSVLLSSGVTFENIPLIEDILFNVKLFYYVASINILDISPYIYMKRIDGSLTNKFVPDYFELHKKRVSIILDQYNEWNMCTDEVKEILAGIYVRYLYSALQRNCDHRSKMNHKQRKSWLVNEYNSCLYNELIPYCYPSDFMVKFMASIIKAKQTFLALCFGRCIYLIKDKFPVVFSALKQKK